MDRTEILINDEYKATYVIYMFKNKVNGKVYVGQTIRPARERILAHIWYSENTKSKNHTYLHRAMHKYSVEKFDVKILERCINQQELDEREIYWIAYFDSTNPSKGYNIESGGKKGKKVPPLSSEHKQKLLEAHLGIPRSEETKKRIGAANKAKWQDKKYYEKNIKRFQQLMGRNKKKVYQYDKDGNFIKEWQSMLDVSKFLYGRQYGSLRRNIQLNINKGKLGFMKNGSIWTYIAPDGKEGLSHTVDFK